MFPALESRANSTTPPQLPVSRDAQYGYVPQEAIAILFVALFGMSTILHIGQAIWFKLWWLLPTAVLCGLGEVIGWSGRLWSSIDPIAATPYLMQISSIIIAPTPLLAANFMISARVIQRLGTSYSRLTPRWYTIVFLPCDIIALVVQGVGGAMASVADTLDGANRGANVMLRGIIFQLVVIIVFSALGADFFLHYQHDRPVRQITATSRRGVLTPKLKIMLSALVFSCVTLFIRSIYRIIELSGGWEGRIIHTEVYFNVLDGGMVTLALWTMDFAHPGLFLVQRECEMSDGELEGKGNKFVETDSGVSTPAAYS